MILTPQREGVPGEGGDGKVLCSYVIINGSTGNFIENLIDNNAIHFIDLDNNIKRTEKVKSGYLI